MKHLTQTVVTHLDYEVVGNHVVFQAAETLVCIIPRHPFLSYAKQDRCIEKVLNWRLKIGTLKMPIVYMTTAELDAYAMGQPIDALLPLKGTFEEAVQALQEGESQHFVACGLLLDRFLYNIWTERPLKRVLHVPTSIPRQMRLRWDSETLNHLGQLSGVVIRQTKAQYTITLNLSDAEFDALARKAVEQYQYLSEQHMALVWFLDNCKSFCDPDPELEEDHDDANS